MLPKPGSKDYDKMIDSIRTDLDSGMQLTKFEMVARKLLKTQGRDFDTEFAKWKAKRETPTPVMKIKCAWCGLDMGTKPCNESQQNVISHSICESCEIKIKKEISEYVESKI